MFPVRIVQEAAKGLGLQFLIIGGHAVNAYAEPRATLDVDFLIRREDRLAWTSLFGDLISITRATSLDPRSTNYHQIFLKHGTQELYERVLARFAHSAR